MDDNTNVVQEIVMNQQQSRVTAGAGAAVMVAAGAVLLVARPWHHDAATPAHRGGAPQASTQAVPDGPVLHHAAVERFLVDLEDATAPVCNGGADITAKLGRTFTCVDGPQHWRIRITEVQPDGGVRYELLD